MSFLKSLCLAILATVFLTFVLGISLLDIFDIDVYMDEQLVEPLKTISVSALVAVALVVAAMAIVLTVFGTIIFAGILIVGSLALVTVGVFWPIFLAAFVIWLIARDKPNRQAVS